MPRPSEPKPAFEPTPTEGPPERRATTGMWLLMIVVAVFAALALLRSLG